MGRAARLNANNNGERVRCDGENCSATMRVDEAEAYTTLVDGSKRYACARCMRQWRLYGFLYTKQG